MVTYMVVALLAGVALGFGLRRGGRAFRTFRGMRVLTCPENRKPAAVELGAWRVALTAILGRPVAQVRDCSRWPERRQCDQACVREIQGAPKATLVHTILANWCRYNACVCCGAPLAKIHVGPHQPYLINQELRIFEWKEIPPQDLPQTLRSCEPVCETCLVAETHAW